MVIVMIFYQQIANKYSNRLHQTPFCLRACVKFNDIDDYAAHNFRHPFLLPINVLCLHIIYTQQHIDVVCSVPLQKRNKEVIRQKKMAIRAGSFYHK